MIKKFIFILVFILNFINPAFANDGPQPPHTINSLDIAQAVMPHMLQYMHFKLIGICAWWKCHGIYCSIHITPELDEYLPDLIVSSYTGQGNDPYWEASQMDKLAYPAGDKLLHTVISAKTGINSKADLANGNVSTVSNTDHYSSLRTKSVDIVGSPMFIFHIPFMTLRSDTSWLFPYYQSDLDTLGRLGFAEFIRPETFTPTNYIGDNFLNHWSYEFPRTMTVNVYNDFKASVVAAQRAADIVTNHNALHTVKSTANSCGKNCVVSNVIEEQKDDHELWQEVYPNNKHIQPGASDLSTVVSTGNADAQQGNNNYVFVLWRHYRGCVQSDGRLIMKSRDVGSPQKR